jgi:hypothetical protein
MEPLRLSGAAASALGAAGEKQVPRQMTNEAESLRMIFTVQVSDPGPLRPELRFSIRRLFNLLTATAE